MALVRRTGEEQTPGAMKLILRAALLCALTSVARSADLKTDPIDAVIAEIMAHPNYHQMCDGADFENKTIPLPIYSRLLGRTNGIAPQHLGILQARRAELVPALKANLAGLHPEKPPKAGHAKAPGVSEIPEQLNALYLFLVSDLHVIEALPELLIVEERLRGAIQFADEHPKSPLPDVAWDGRISHYEKHPPPDRERALEFYRADQRELLSLMLRLLREQRFPPLMASTFEKRYREGVDAEANKPDQFGRLDSSAIDQRNRLAEEEKSNPEFLIPFRGDGIMITVPFKAQERNEVRSLARQFLETVPPEQWKRVAP